MDWERLPDDETDYQDQANSLLHVDGFSLKEGQSKNHWMLDLVKRLKSNDGFADILNRTFGLVPIFYLGLLA